MLGVWACSQRATCSSFKRSRVPGRSWRSPLLLGVLTVLMTVLGIFLLCGYPGGEMMEVLAAQHETLQHKFLPVPCSQDYGSHKQFTGCTPLKCGRAVTDAVITQEEARRMWRIAEAGLSLGGSDGGASILDLHSGALSMGKNFVNIYRYYGEQMKDVLTEEDFQLYRNVRRRIQQEIARTFHLDASALHLTKPTFFSRMNSSEAKTTHDEYWHPHIDKVTYGSFDYTSLLYLSDYSRDFGGGRFIFIDEKANSTVEPRLELKVPVGLPSLTSGGHIILFASSTGMNGRRRLILRRDILSTWRCLLGSLMPLLSSSLS
ncbi:2-oxoglutarate and iron-dependent oxygenase domain-containing protein 3 isoform X2 [Dendrobates tinctorius]|uniref:2-oxoglutarate and iron-dependent oxygenase domain-containing protein 3 isoform X2 n=1 Tax=Dendrobates tinctorius TaxID=92724 RepID=UPI003CC9D857